MEDLRAEWDEVRRRLRDDFREQDRIWQSMLQSLQPGPLALVGAAKSPDTTLPSEAAPVVGTLTGKSSMAQTVSYGRMGSEQDILNKVHGDLVVSMLPSQASRTKSGSSQAQGGPGEPAVFDADAAGCQEDEAMLEAPVVQGEPDDVSDGVQEKPLDEMISSLHARRNSIFSYASWGGSGSANRHAHNVASFVYGKKRELGIKGTLLRMMYLLSDWWVHLSEPLRVGKLAKLVTSPGFEVTTIFVVIVNCIFIIHQNNVNIANLGRDEALPGYFKFVDAAFAAYFTIELSLRLRVHRLYFFVNEDMNWNILDLTIVLISVVQSIQSFVEDSMPKNFSFLRSFRVLKLCRVLRLLRMIKIFTDLRVMVTAFLNSCLALFWCMVLLFFTVTMFALVIVQVIGDYMVDNLASLQVCDDGGECLLDQLLMNFGSVQRSMLSLYMATTGGNDWAFYYDMVSQTSWVSGALFVFYTMFYYFGVFNLVTGMFVDKAVRASQPDADMLVFEQRHLEREFTQGFLAIFHDYDVDQDGQVDKEEFRKMIASDAGRIYLGMLGLEPKDSKIVFDSLAEVASKVPVADFVKGCMRMRGGATSLDTNAMQFELKIIHHNVVLLHQAVAELRKSARATRGQPHMARMTTPTAVPRPADGRRGDPTEKREIEEVIACI